MYSYKTVTTKVEEVLFKDKKSKFYAFVYPLASEDEVKPIVEALKKKYPTANHICYAWQIGVEQKHYRANDDGEPNNTAGQPIYGQIQSHDLTNIGIFVARIFGGTKLGVGGLINAYRSAAQLALEEAEIIEKEITVRIQLKFEYKHLNTIMYIIKKYQLTLIEQNTNLNCDFTLEAPLQYIDTVSSEFEPLHEIDFKRLTP